MYNKFNTGRCKKCDDDEDLILKHLFAEKKQIRLTYVVLLILKNAMGERNILQQNWF